MYTVQSESFPCDHYSMMACNSVLIISAPSALSAACQARFSDKVKYINESIVHGSPIQ